jgi:predicted DCC family thiol-disulfide oxidoreductase YuxK
MKLSQSTVSLAVLVNFAQHASAFTGPEFPRVSSLIRSTTNSAQYNCSPSQLHTMSAMNILREEEEKESSTATSSSIEQDNQISKGPLSAAAVTVTPVTSEVDWDWEELASSVFSKGDLRPVVLFDGVCNLCNGGVNFAMDHDEAAKLRFCSLQTKTAQSLLLKAGHKPADMNKIVLVTRDKTYFSSDAVTRICQQLDVAPLQWIGRIGRVTPKWIREPILDFVSEHRYQFGEYDSCRLDFDGTLTSRFVSDPADIADV